MNQLSWLLYLAAVCGNLNIICTIGFFVVLGLFIICGAISLWADYDETKETARKAMKVAVLPSIVVLLLYIFVPDSKTLYAIAASQVGDQVLHSQLGSKAEQALNAWLNEQINKAKQ